VTFYSAPFTFDYVASQILVDGGTVSITCSALYTAIKLAQMDIEGIIYPKIANGSGLNALAAGVQVGLTVSLLNSWQLKFPAGSYVATVVGGNLIGGLGGVPVAYSAGVQVALILSANATVVGGSDPFANISESGQSYGKQLRDMRAALLGVTTGAGTVSEKFKAADGTTDRVTSTNDGTNRIAVAVPGS
jgi:hypothetical protein